MGLVEAGESGRLGTEARRGTSAFPSGWRDWYARRQSDVDGALVRHLKSLKSRPEPHSRLVEAVEYSLVQPGKRLRPILVLESCLACGGRDEQAWPAALAVECIHTFSLIHDDLPAMDNDDLRRGRPTNHVVFGDALAILAGDWLGAHAFELIASADVPAETRGLLVGELATATGDMVVGQAADIAGETRPIDAELVHFIHVHKTSRLIAAACRMGAISAGASAALAQSLGRYGAHLGVAFQIVDDLLDATGTSTTLGKRAGKDAVESKQTYPAAFGLDQSRARAEQEINAALAAVESLGERGGVLRELARYVVSRDR